MTIVPSAPLDRRDAGPLLVAWISWLGAVADVRALLIKGISLEHHGLRRTRISSDVDVLVHPADMPRVRQALENAGWELRPTTFAQSRYTLHSVSLLHPSWPIDIDLHQSFPGFLKPAGVVFDELWDRRVAAQIAGVTCWLPDYASSALILALHSLRGMSAEPRHLAELVDLRRRLDLDEPSRLDLLSLAQRTGSDATLDEFLTSVGVSVPARDTPDPGLDEWRRRIESPSRTVHMWTRLIRSAPPAQRLRIVCHALWPTRDDLRVIFPTEQHGWVRDIRLRLRRLRRAIPLLAGVVRGISTSRN